MFAKVAALCAFNAVCWATAPLIGRLSSANGMVMAVAINFGSLVAVLPIAFTQNYAAVGFKGLMVALVAGIINGAGVIAFYQLVYGSAQGHWEASKIIPIVFVLVPVLIVFGAKFLFSEAITAQKVVGISFACVAIWLLSK